MVAVLAIILAPFVVITAILTWFGNILESPVVGKFLQGAAAAVTALIIVAAWSIGKSLLRGVWNYISTFLFVLAVGGKILSPLQGVVAVLTVNLLFFSIYASDDSLVENDSLVCDDGNEVT